MAKIIAFYVPSSFRKKATESIPKEQYGKLIPFGLPQKEVGLTVQGATKKKRRMTDLREARIVTRRLHQLPRGSFMRQL
jgi:hypothetical protein